MQKLPLSFYQRRQVATIARELLGKILVTQWDGMRTTGRIVETEAYEGEEDRACHAAKGRTGRTEVMYGTGGRAYIYLIYGMHEMFNIVTSGEGEPHAVLIRAVEPLEGIDAMLERTGKKKADLTLTSGPGRVGRAFGFRRTQNGTSLISEELHIIDDGYCLDQNLIVAGPRINVDYAGDHAHWPYRFYVKGNRFVSGKK